MPLRRRASSRGRDSAQSQSSSAVSAVAPIDNQLDAQIEGAGEEEAPLTPVLDAAALQQGDGEADPDEAPPPEIQAENATEAEPVDPEPDPDPQAQGAAVEEGSPDIDEQAEVEEPAEDQAAAQALGSAIAEGAAPSMPPVAEAPQAGLQAALGVPTVQAPAPVDGPKDLKNQFQQEVGVSPEAQAATSQALLDGVQADAAAMQTEVADSHPDFEAQLNAIAEARIAEVESVAASLHSQILSAFTEATNKAADQCAQAQSAIEGHLETSLANIDGAEAAALAALDQQILDAEGRLAGAVSEGAARLGTVLTDAAGEIEAMGTTQGDAAVRIGGEHATNYAGRGGDRLERKRNEARAKAARDVGAGYRDSFLERTGQTANELRQAAGNLGPGLDEGAAQVSAELGTLEADGRTEIQNQAEHARNQARADAAAAKGAAEQAWIGFVTSLDEQQVAALQAHEEATASIVGTIRTTAGEASAELAAAIDAGVAWFDTAMATVAAAAAQDGWAPDTLIPYLDEVRGQLEQGRDDMLAGGDEVVSAFDQALAEQVATALTELQGSASQAVSAVQSASQSYQAGLDQLVNDTAGNIAGLASGAAEGMDFTAEQVGTMAGQYIEAFEGSIDRQEESLQGEMTTVKSGTQSQLSNALGQLPGEIQTEAEKAAEKIQPWWKKALATVVTIVVAVAVFAVVAAICVATFGTGLVVAGLIAGAAAGLAATLASDVVNMATGVQEGFSSWRTYAANMVMGAVGGAIGGFTAGMSALATGAIAGLGTGIADSLTRVLILGEEFSIGRFVTMTLVSGLTAGLLAKFVNTPVRNRIDPSAKNWNTYQQAMQHTSARGGQIGDVVADNITGNIVGATVNGPAADAATPEAAPEPLQVSPDYGGDRPQYSGGR